MNRYLLVMTENKPELYELAALLQRQGELVEQLADGDQLKPEILAADVRVHDARLEGMNHFVSILFAGISDLYLVAGAMAALLGDEELSDEELREKLAVVRKLASQGRESAEFDKDLYDGFFIGDQDAKARAMKAKPQYFPTAAD